MMAIRRHFDKIEKRRSTSVIGAAWYRSDQWDRLKEVSEDRADLEETWEEWSREAEKTLQGIRAKGLDVTKVDVDVEELVRWCQANRRPINAASRSAFAAEKLLKGSGK